MSDNYFCLERAFNKSSGEFSIYYQLNLPHRTGVGYLARGVDDAAIKLSEVLERVDSSLSISIKVENFRREDREALRTGLSVLEFSDRFPNVKLDF